MRENRLVLPIPPGTYWSDAKPAILPGMENVNVLPAGSEAAKREKKPRSRKKRALAPEPSAEVHASGMWFAPPASDT